MAPIDCCLSLTVSMQSYITFTGTVPLMAHMHIVITSHLPKYPVVPASAGKPVSMSQGNLQHLCSNEEYYYDWTIKEHLPYTEMYMQLFS